MSRDRDGAAAIESPGNGTLVPLVVDLLLHSFVEPGVPVTKIYELATKRFRVRECRYDSQPVASFPHPLRGFGGRESRDRPSVRILQTR